MLLTDRRVLHSLVAAVAGVTLVCVVDSTAWVHRPFMGFLLGRNRIVAPDSPAFPTRRSSDLPFGAELIAVDGRPVGEVADLVGETWARSVGTPVRYTFMTPGGRIERTVPVMRFTLGDYISLFGVWLVNGVVFLVLAFVVAYLKPGRPASAAMFVFCLAWGLVMVVSMGDFYRFHFRSLYALAQAVAPAALLMLVFTFPDRPAPRHARALLAVLAAVTAVQVGLDIGLYERAPRLWMRFFDASVIYFAAMALAACALMLAWYRGAGPEGRVRAQVVALGSLIA